MRDEFLTYYNQELASLRDNGQEFAKAYPKVAGRLRMGAQEVDDPFAARVIESTAFLTARIQYNIDHFTDSLNQQILTTLFPHYYLPIPSCSILEYQVDPKSDTPFSLLRETEIVTEEENNQCRFSSVYDVDIWPITISEVSYCRELPSYLSQVTTKASCLKVELKTLQSTNLFSSLPIDFLRFYINLTHAEAIDLHQHIINHCVDIILTDDKNKIFHLSKKQLQTVGFNPDESLFPMPTTSYAGYRLITEYFSLPQKFLFFDLINLQDCLSSFNSTNLTIHFIIQNENPDLNFSLNHNSIKLNCTPIINLFKIQGEPITVTQHQHEYQLSADHQIAKECIEIYQVTAMKAVTNDNQSLMCLPYFSANYHQQHNAQKIYWTQTRKPCWQLGQYNLSGYEVFISFSDLAQPFQIRDLVMTPSLYCTNRDKPKHLPYGGGKPTFKFSQTQYDGILGMNLLQRFSDPYYRQINSQENLLDHIFLQQINMTDEVTCITFLQKLVKLYRGLDTVGANKLADAFIKVKTTPATVRHPMSLRQGFCQGLDFKLYIDDEICELNEMLFFANILQQFLQYSCAINHFIRLIICNRSGQEIKTWQVVLGSQIQN